MVKIITGSRMGTKAICAVTDAVTLDSLPLKATANGDGTGKLDVVDATANQSLASMVLGIKDNGPAWASVWGVSGVPVSADISAAATAVTDAPTTGQKICIDDIIVGASVAQVLTFTCETDTTVILILRVPAGQSMQFTFRGKRKLASANKKLLCQSSVAGTTSVCVGYHSEA